MQRTVKIMMPGNFCKDYFCAWDSPVRGLLQQQGRAPLPRNVSRSAGFEPRLASSRLQERLLHMDTSRVPPSPPA